MQATQKTRVQYLGGKDPLEKEMSMYFSILTEEFSWTVESGGLQTVGSQRVEHGHNLVTKQQHYGEQYGGSLKN